MSPLKPIELWIRRHFNRHIGAQRIPILVSSPQLAIPVEDPVRILVLRQDRIGDVLVSVPVIRALRERFSAATIDMVMSQNNIAVLDAVAPFINDVIVHHKGLPGLLRTQKELRSRRYDVVIDLMDNASSTSALLIRSSRARYAVGIDKENRGVYTHVVPLADRASVHIVDRIARLLWPFAIDPSTIDLHLAFPLRGQDVQDAYATVRAPSSAVKILGVNISGSDVSRMYTEVGIIDIVNHCMTSHTQFETVVMCAAQHQEMQERISRATGARAIPPTASFGAWAANIAQLDAFFTPDTSSVHLAAAFNIPSVVLYVHDRADLMPWYPYDTPCFPVETTTGTIAEIPIRDILRAVDQLLS
ncbi:MAG TPA: glycosyltransferase family 9 protein [Candidatus Didemnitutus sp.]|nr:glycosyltransferase family 9 protein [Candidatus Didemnitutus sp.]